MAWRTLQAIMTNVLGLVSLLITLMLVGVLAKKQLAPAASSGVAIPSAAGVLLPATSPIASLETQAVPLPQQVKQAVEASLQQARPVQSDQ